MELALIARRRKAEIALESDDVILKLKYLLEKLAEKLPGGLGAEVLEATFKLLETLVVRYPRTVNRYVEHVALNFDIWGHSASELQYFVIDLMNKMIFDPERHQLSKEDVVDHLLNCIEKLAAARAPDRRNIETLSQMVRKILAESSLSKLMSYLNIPHLQQRHPNYEAPLSAFLHIFFEIFRSRTRGPPLIFSLLTVLLHFLATPAPAESKSWLSEGRLELRHLSVDFGPDLHSKQSSNAATTVILGGSERLVEGESVDAVLAGYIFAAITFDWKRIKGTAKALAKEPEKVKQLESITKDLAGQSDKAKISTCLYIIINGRCNDPANDPRRVQGKETGAGDVYRDHVSGPGTPATALRVFRREGTNPGPTRGTQRVQESQALRRTHQQFQCAHSFCPSLFP